MGWRTQLPQLRMMTNPGSVGVACAAALLSAVAVCVSVRDGRRAHACGAGAAWAYVVVAGVFFALHACSSRSYFARAPALVPLNDSAYEQLGGASPAPPSR